MFGEKPLVFNPQVASKKPTNKQSCPFCEREGLENIIATKEDCIWLTNKYATLQKTEQTLIIESKKHLGDISNYSVLENRKVFSFAVSKWFEMIALKKYKNVLMYKNHGPLSGGSLRHPHMQIVGLEDNEPYKQIQWENFKGIQVAQTKQFEINISQNPLVGFCEFNVIVDTTDVNSLADGVKSVVEYVLQDYFHGKCDSYNLFFYLLDGKIICKIIPRFVVSPYYLGYGLAQVNDDVRLREISTELLTKMNGKSSIAI